MAIAFKKYQRQDSTLTELGTVKSLAGKGGKIAFSRKNLKNKQKLVAVFLTKKNGESAVIPCSEQVSQLVRAGEITLPQLAGLQVCEGEHESGELRQFICMPQGGGMKEFKTDDLKDESFEASDEFMPEGFLEY